jgi:hypothetical protein
MLDIRAQVAARAGIVDEDFTVEPDIEQRHAIGRAVRADGREPAAEAVRQQLLDPRVGHDAVGPPYLWCAHRGPLYVRASIYHGNGTGAACSRDLTQ